MFGFFGVGECGVVVFDFDVFFDVVEYVEFGFDGDVFGVGFFDNAFGDFDVFFEWVVGGVDYYGVEEVGVDVVVVGGFVIVVEVDGENGFGEDFVGGVDDCFEYVFVGVVVCVFGNLDDERCFGVDGVFEEIYCLFGVIDVVGVDGVFVVGVFEELCGGNDYRWVWL